MLLSISVLALLPQQKEVVTLGWDKLNHVAAFAALGLVAWQAFPGRLGWVVFGLLGYGIGLEFAQALTPSRTASVLDLVADGVGLLVALVVIQGLAFSRRTD